MAEHILETRLLLRYATYNQWMNSDLILKVGEPAVAVFPNNRTVENMSNSAPDYTPPAIGLKIGDGKSRFYALPWVQAVAADVYQWAKSITKPTYSANEIAGLDSYIEEHAGGSGGSSGTAATRRYQIVQGTDDNVNKYYLRYRDDDESTWTVDYNHYIDLNAYAELLEWIGNDINNFSSLGNRTDDHIMWRLSELALADEDQEHRFVTSVSQTNGQITVNKTRPTFNDISGVLNVESGGTGATSFESGQALIGNDTGPIRSIEISTSVESTRTLVYNYAVKAYVDQAVAGLTGAMHFIGESTVVINGAVNPQIPDYDFSKAQPGDVILSDAKEYVWTGGTWRLLGDEGSYAVKGSITNADISDNAAISISKIGNLLELLATKVDKEAGKTLTSNDFTDEDKEKLDLIDDGAQVNKIEHILVNGTEVAPTTIDDVPKSVNIEFLPFTQTEKTKLAQIEEGAQVNKIETITINGTDYVPNGSKKVNITIDQAALDLDVLAGARVPGTTEGQYEDVDIIASTKQLDLARVAKTGYISDLREKADTYITLYCGSSTEVI